jgi:hypothetical protein
MRTPEEIRDVPAEQRTPDELYRYGTDGPWPGRPLPAVHVRAEKPKPCDEETQ